MLTYPRGRLFGGLWSALNVPVEERRRHRSVASIGCCGWWSFKTQVSRPAPALDFGRCLLNPTVVIGPWLVFCDIVWNKVCHFALRFRLPYSGVGEKIENTSKSCQRPGRVNLPEEKKSPAQIKLERMRKQGTLSQASSSSCRHRFLTTSFWLQCLGVLLLQSLLVLPRKSRTRVQSF